MWLLVGLGNPGERYARNRHNIGFMAVEALAQDAGAFSPFSEKSKFHGAFTESTIDGQKVGLLKPSTYMNESGRSVGAVAKFYKIPAEKIIVFHDELDLDPAKLRIKLGGGNAGHNGLRSIQAHLGTPDFWRARLGIGHPGQKERVHGYVLSDFAKADQDWVSGFISALPRHIALLLSGHDADFMNKVAIDVKGTK